MQPQPEETTEGKKAGPGLGRGEQGRRNTEVEPQGLDSQMESRVTFGQKEGEGKPRRRRRCQTLHNPGTAPPVPLILLPADASHGHAQARPGARQEGAPTGPLLPSPLPALATGDMSS